MCLGLIPGSEVGIISGGTWETIYGVVDQI